MAPNLSEASLRLRSAVTDACRGLVDREALVELVALSAVAREHLLVIGPPGTAKSVAVRRIAQATGGRYFEYLLGRFTEPNEIFGPVDLRKLREGTVETDVSGMLPEAEIAFLDEIFQGSSAILNTLLGILNERVFRRGHTQLTCPLRICVGASNNLPTDESLAAFADRFLVRVFVEAIDDPQLETLLDSGWRLDHSKFSKLASMDDIDSLAEAAQTVDLASVRPQLAHVLRILRSAGVVLSDRRVVKAQSLVAAAGVLAGRSRPSDADLWPLIYVVPTQEQQEIARESLRDLLRHTENVTLPAAAEEASAGPLVRARRLVLSANRLLTERPDRNLDAAHSWRLKLEGVAREIDASFTAESMPSDLTEVRARIVDHLKPLSEAPN
jgi:MoxR-like ATPase